MSVSNSRRLSIIFLTAARDGRSAAQSCRYSDFSAKIVPSPIIQLIAGVEHWPILADIVVH